MPLIDISPVGSFGIISDIPAHELAPEAWSAGANVRTREGAIETVNGNTQVYGALPIAPYWALNVITPVEQYWIYAGLNDVYDTDGNTNTLISALGGYNASADINWSGMEFNGVPILNNGVERPQMQAPAQRGTQLTDLLNWPGTLRARVLRAFGNFLVALDLLDGSTRNPYGIRWSDPAGPGAVPGSWDITDPTKRAGERTFAETNGFVIDCLPLSNINVIYKEDRIWSMQFIGGTNVFAFNEMFHGKGGILTRRCVAEFFKKHFVVVKGDILVHDGNSIDSIVEAKKRRQIFSVIDGENAERTFVYPNYATNEMWVCIPEQGYTLPTRIFAWNWTTNTWSEWRIGDFASSTIGIAHIARGIIETNPEPVIDSFNQVGVDEINSNNNLIDGSRLNPAVLEALFVRPDPAALLQYGTLAGLHASPAYIERTGLAITGRNRGGAPKVDMNRVKFLRGIIPRFSNITGTGKVNISAGYQEYPMGPVTWAPAYAFDPSTDRIAPFLDVSGKLLAVKFESTSNSWRLEGYQLDIELGGTA